MLFVLLVAIVLPHALFAGPSPRPWPSCVLQGKVPRKPQPALADVRRFIRNPDVVRHRTVTFNSAGNIGLLLRQQPHDLGEMVEDVQPASQGFESGVRRGWIIVAINGKAFSKTERLTDIANDFGSAKSKAATLEVKFDVRTHLDCTNADCRSSNTFPTSSMRRCAEACGQVAECYWWSYGDTDEDSMCSMYSSVSGFVKTDTGSTGPRTCVPIPVMSNETGWPNCVTADADLHYGQALYTDVRNFISRSEAVRHRELIFSSEGEIGMVLKWRPHDLGEIVSSVQKGSQAQLLGVQAGWIIREVDGKPFNKSQMSLDVGDVFTSAKKRGATLTVNFDVKTSQDCTDGDCKRSDKFPATSQDSCASACGKIPECASWSFAVEDEDSMCWLRKDVPSSLRPHDGSVMGVQACRPSSVGNLMFIGMAVCVVVYLLYQYGDTVRGVAPLSVVSRLFSKEPHYFAGRAMELSSVQNGEDELESLVGQCQRGYHHPSGSSWLPNGKSISSWGGKLAATFGTSKSGAIGRGGAADTFKDFLEDDDL